MATADIRDTSVRSWPIGLVITATALLVSFKLPDDRLVWFAVLGAGLTAATVIALWTRSAPGIRATIFMDAVFLVFALGTRLGWPPAVTTTLVCVVPLSLLLACGRTASLRPVAPWLRAGRMTPELPWLAGVTIGASALALILWALATGPAPAPYLLGLRELPLWAAVLGVIGFALVNPIWEELLYRGILFTELESTLGTRAALVTQAAVFGFAHLSGFPSGWLGMLMAASWGLMLGVMRLKSGGVLIPYIAHVCANSTIGILAVAILP